MKKPRFKFDHPPFHYPPSAETRLILPLLHDGTGDITVYIDKQVTVPAAKVPDFAKYRIAFVLGAHVIDVTEKLDKQQVAIAVAIAKGPARDLGWRVTRNIMSIVISEDELEVLKQAAGL